MSEQKKYLSAEEIFAEEEQEELRREQKRLADLRDSEEGELEDLKPRNTWATVRRLWDEAADQRWRFVVVVIAIVFYTVCSIAAPAYSAHLIDYIWTQVQAADAAGKQFSIGWGTGGEKILFYLGIWTVALVFYSTQSLCMASFAERLNLNLRNRLAAKLNRPRQDERSAAARRAHAAHCDRQYHRLGNHDAYV